jgi:iron complex outermembrane receptor protein
LFEIDRGREYYDISNPTSPRYVQDGRQVHRGFEFTSSGRPTEALTLIAGFSLLDPKIKKDPDLDGKSPENVAKTSIKLYAEYDVAAIPGLTLTGGAFHTGRQYADVLNQQTLDAFTTLDVGGRIVLPLKEDRKLTLRMNINNLTGEDYWLLNRSLGPARSLMFSAQLDL